MLIQDWRRHKPRCKAEIDSEAASHQQSQDPDDVSDGIVSSEPTVSAYDEDEEPVDGHMTIGDPNSRSTDGKERVVYMRDPRNPGETIRMTSRSMSAAFMREVRDSAFKGMDRRTAARTMASS